MEEPLLVSNEHDGSIGSTHELPEDCLIKDAPSYQVLEQENHRLQLEVKGLRVQLARSTAELVEEEDKNHIDTLSGVSQIRCLYSLC